MKILFTRFPLESTYGGAEIQTMSLMKGLMQRGHAVAFLGSCPTLLRMCREEGIPAAKLEIGPPPVTTWGAISFAWRKQSMRRKLEIALEQFHDLDAICMLSLSEKLLLTTEAVHNKTRVFWIEHDRIGRWLTKNPWLPKLRELSKKATTITVSELSRKMYIALEWDPKNIVAIPNGIDSQRLVSDKNYPLSATRYALRLGCIARLSPEKGIDVLLEAIRDLPTVSLDIVGKGSEESYLRNLISEIHQKDGIDPVRIRLLPHVDDLGTFYRSIDVLVLPSREHDPFGMVAAEAMMCGVATIVTDACGIADYLENGKDALVVKADDIGTLRETIVGLEQGSARQEIGKHSRTTALEKFSLDRMIDSYVDVLSNKSSENISQPHSTKKSS